MTNPVGRPPSLTDEDLEKITRAAAFGLDDKQLACIWGITEQTLNNYKLRYPQFFESLKAAKLESDMEVIKALRERALGYEHPEIKHFVMGKKIVEREVTKHYPPDSTSLCFWLKNRLPDQFRDKQEVDHQVTMPDISFNRDKPKSS